MADIIINGTDANESFTTSASNNAIITAGKGNDTITLAGPFTPGATPTTADLIYGPGFGHDTLIMGRAFIDTTLRVQVWNPPVDAFKISFGAGISASDVSVRVLDDTLVPANGRTASYMTSAWQLVIKSTGESITITDHNSISSGLHDLPSALQQVSFADGTLWRAADIAAQWRVAANSAYTVYGSTGDDLLQGNADQHALRGDAGNDTIVSGSGNELIQPGAGNNVARFGQGAPLPVIQRSTATPTAHVAVAAHAIGARENCRRCWSVPRCKSAGSETPRRSTAT